MKKLTSLLMSTAVLLAVGTNVPAVYMETCAVDTGVNVAGRTPEEIKQYIDAHPFDEFAGDSYSVSPSTSYPYTAGSLDDKSLDNALNTLNCMRYIAGLPEVTLNSEYNKYEQAAALVNCVNNEISHYPTQPSDMPDDIFSLAEYGASQSNLFCTYSSWGFKLNVSYSILSYMDDSDSSNIARVGHRRWCLNPEMLETGFGAVENHSAMYAFDQQRNATETGVCWPAQNMPTEYFDNDIAWSISMGKAVDSSAVEVTLTRKSDSAEWKFSSTSADGDFYTDNSLRGQTGCIIFRPSGIEYNSGDVFNVKIEGMETPVEYTVNFFSLSEVNTGTDTYFLGDVDNDSFIDSNDASFILADYARTSTGEKSSLTAEEFRAADINADGIADAADSSLILAFYSYISTTSGNISMKEWLLTQ